MRLLVNIDHVATLRNARGEGVPDPVRAARVAEEAGAAGIVFHLREDRRHIRDEDVFRLKKSVHGLLVFEMAGTAEMVDICRKVKPEFSTLVPERREELTTEGGLNLSTIGAALLETAIRPLQERGIAVSLFIDPDEKQILKAGELGVEAVELHTGTFALAATDKKRKKELDALKNAAELAHSLGMEVNAGHGLNFENIDEFVSNIPHVHDISIGHALIGESIFSGLDKVVARMNRIITETQS